MKFLDSVVTVHLKKAPEIKKIPLRASVGSMEAPKVKHKFRPRHTSYDPDQYATFDEPKKAEKFSTFKTGKAPIKIPEKVPEKACSKVSAVKGKPEDKGKAMNGAFRAPLKEISSNKEERIITTAKDPNEKENVDSKNKRMSEAYTIYWKPEQVSPRLLVANVKMKCKIIFGN